MIFTPDDVHARIRTQPFVPLQIVTTTGQVYDVYHPDLVIVGRRFVILGMPSLENPTHADQVTRIALVHVTELRDLPSMAPSSNGPAA